MQRRFDITDFGAVGDGKTDCTQAVQRALDCAADCMGEVVVPPGIYMVGALKMKGSHTSLTGTSAWSFREDGASVLCLNDETAAALLDISCAFGCTVKGMCLNGGGLGEGIHGIKLYHTQYNGGGEEDTPTIDDCRIGNFSGDGLHFEHVWCFSVRHSMLHRNRGAGLYIDGWDAFIIDNWFTGNKKGGLLSGENACSITCTGNRVEWNSCGGFIIGRSECINITGNYFDRSFGPAIVLGAENKPVTAVTITGNILYRNGAYDEARPLKDEKDCCHIRMQNASGVVISGNSLRMRRGDNGKGVFSPDYSFVISGCTNCIVKDNVLHNACLKQQFVIENDNDGCMFDGNVGAVAKILS